MFAVILCAVAVRLNFTCVFFGYCSLVTIQAEHAIGEYAKGTHVKTQFEERYIRKRFGLIFIAFLFSTDNIIQYRHNHHEENFKALCQKNEAWGTGYCKAVYKAIAESSGFDDNSSNTGEDMNEVTTEDLEEGLLSGPF